MRYIPQSKYTLEEIIEQCHPNRIRVPEYSQPKFKVSYADVRKFLHYADAELVAH